MKAWLAALFAVFSCLAAAQGFPSKPLRILVPFPPGSGTDVAARALAEHLQRDLGQPVVVDNRPGGNSVIATEAAARAETDGQTLPLTTDFHSINAAFGLRLPYDSLADFAFVARASTSPLMLVAHPDAGVKTLAAVAAAKAAPGKLSFASLGSSSPHHLGFEWFKRMAGIDMLDVPYKGGGPALAVTGPQRAAVAPEVPTFAESGYPQFVLLNWYGILAPRATPREAVARFNGSIVAALKGTEVPARLAGAGVDAAPSTPEELEQWVREDIARYRRIIELTGARPEGR
ncbi:MAG: tripartite tricarboxylate transporter substrate-binding protein [Pseudomonadota bacterium]